MWFCCDGEQAVGFLLQALPVNDEDRSEEDWQHIYTLACTIKDEELLSLCCEEMLHRLFHEEEVHLFAGEPVRFQCTCSMERSRNALAVLGRDDLQKIFAERDSVSVDCQFCGKHYQYNEQDMADILGQQSSRLH
jgi:molecular chaperone Hsp33